MLLCVVCTVRVCFWIRYCLDAILCFVPQVFLDLFLLCDYVFLAPPFRVVQTLFYRDKFRLGFVTFQQEFCDFQIGMFVTGFLFRDVCYGTFVT